MNTFQFSQDLYDFKKNSVGYSTGKVDTRIEIVKNWIGENKKILDAGCYDGFYAEVFKKNNNEVYGMDASKTAVREAIKRGINARIANLEDTFPFPNDFFDIVHAGEVIEHLFNTDKFVEECHRVLKKNGRLIITTPNTLSLPRRIVYLFGIGRFFEASNSFSSELKSVGHIRFFTKKLLKDFIESKGFKMVAFTSDFVNFPFFKSNFLARIKPTFGRTLIGKFKNIK